MEFINNSRIYWGDFLITFFSVLITAWIGWIVYKQQQKEKRIKDDILAFSLLFFSITNNLENTTASVDKANKTITEIENFITAINKMKYYIDSFHNVQQLDLSICFSDENAKKNYIISELDKLKDNLVLRETYTKMIGLLSDINYEKEALFLVNWGNLKFQSVYKNLLSEYKKLNEIIILINQNIEDEIKNDKKRKKLIFMCDINDENYSNIIEQKIQELLYYKNLYELFKESAECILFYSDLAYKHLMFFNDKYAKKYKNIILNLDISFSKLSIENKIYDLEETEYYKKNLGKYELYSELPSYKLLNWSFREKIIGKFNEK